VFNPETGKAVIVAFDHGTEGAVTGGEDVPAMMQSIGVSRAEGVLLTTGAAPHFRSTGPRIIAGLDIPVFSTRIGSGEKLRTTCQPWSPRDARAAGAEMCKVLLPMGLTDTEAWTGALERIGGAAASARDIGLPLMLEPAFWGPDQVATDDAIIDASRLCVELGADVLKVPSTESPVALEKIVRWSPVPVLVLGGTPRDGGDFLVEVKNWMEAGVAGVVVGRNVWNRPAPAAAIDALGRIVHQGDLEGARAQMIKAGDPLYDPALRYDEG